MILTACPTVIHTSNGSKESSHRFHVYLYQNAKFLRVELNLRNFSFLKISDSIQPSSGNIVGIPLIFRELSYPILSVEEF